MPRIMPCQWTKKKKRTFHQKIDAMNEKDGVAMPREKRTAAVLYLV